MKTYYGIKSGMTQAWTVSGLRLPVTIIKASPMTVTQVKQSETDGYSAVQVGIGSRRAITMTKPVAKHVEKANVTPKTIKEVRLTETAESAVGEQITIDQVVKVGDVVKVSGASKGRGFSGVMKRWGFKGGPKTHGQSDRWRAPGSIGQGTSPGRIHKGKKMAGHYGEEMFTIKNLQVIKVDPQTQEVWVNGPIPGATDAVVTIEVTKEGKFEGLREVAPVESASEPETTTENKE
jgi:large subunit ribosomal protein L3